MRTMADVSKIREKKLNFQPYGTVDILLSLPVLSGDIALSIGTSTNYVTVIKKILTDQANGKHSLRECLERFRN
jgi:hypothetical protein